MLKNKSRVNKHAVLAVILMMAMLVTSCSFKTEDDTPPSAPLLTVVSVQKDAVELAWSESHDDVGVDEYRLYRDGDLLAKVDDTEYRDRDVSAGNEYEYYVVAYDKAGNRSAKSIKQRVKVDGEGKDEPADPDPKAGKDEPTSGDISIQKLSRSTVKLYTLDDNLNIIAMGSGTIISKDGYILTNFHCVGNNDGSLSNSEGYVAIAITDDVKKNIQPQYIAQFRSGVQELDLAVIKIIADLNWNRISPEDLNLVPIKISDSDKVALGDAINILGYPGVGGETITFTSGSVSGFLDENNDNEIDWIKTDAFVNHGNSGGTAINKNGEMIGIPTAKIVLAEQDNDTMFFLKPVNQALPIIEDAIAQGDNPNLPRPGRPNPGTQQGAEIAIYGRILDAYTYEAIPGAAFVILKEGITIEKFANNPQDSMILAYAESDINGEFVCYDVPVGASYSVIVGADYYDPIILDNALQIPSNWNGDMDIGDVYLQFSQY